MNVGRGAPAIQMSNLNMLVRLSGPEGPFWGPQLQFRCRILAGGEWIRVALGVVVVCVWRGEAQGQFRCGTIVWGGSEVEPVYLCGVRNCNSEVESYHGGKLNGAE